MITINVTTQDMYRQYCECLYDIMGDTTINALDPDLVKNLHALATGDMKRIRQMFIDGYTIMLVDSDVIDPYPVPRTDDLEIRVYHENKLIGVVIDAEINY